MKSSERLLKYVKIFTTSDEDSGKTPSSSRQFDLAKILVDELIDLGVKDAFVDDNCYVYGHIPASKGYENCKKIGFIAHMDTAPDFCGDKVNPVIVKNYDGSVIKLGQSGRVLDPDVFPHLKGLVGKTLITTDGTTLLGADDKAGVAEIMTLADEIMKSGEPHPAISIGFTPDEEIGEGADHFDIKTFGADIAYTCDGSDENGIEYENFNAASATVKVNGINIHPGDAKDKMLNAQLIAMEFDSMLPKHQTPRDTEGREGFFHLCDMNGNVESASLYYIIRDHDGEKFALREKTVKEIGDKLNEKYGKGTVSVTVKEQYRNMIEKIEPCFYVIEKAEAAIKAAGLTPESLPIRGGTDGARLSFMGLPCPDLGTGGHAFHGPFEHIAVESMDKSVEILHNIVKEYTK